MFFCMQDKTTSSGHSGAIFILPMPQQWNITTEKTNLYFYQVQTLLFFTWLPWPYVMLLM